MQRRTIQSAARTQKGHAKKVNDDAVLQDSHNGIFAVADGSTRRNDGPGAARIFLNTIIDHSEEIVRAVEKATPEQHDSLRQLFQEAFVKASQAIATSDPTGKGGTSTGTVLILQEARAAIAHVGNTRAYLLRGEKAFRLTRDHTLAQRMADAGQIPQDAIGARPERKTLYQALGQGDALEVDVTLFEVQDGDRFVLASDGITDVVRGSEMSTIHQASPDHNAFVRTALELAAARGSLDDLSCLVVGIGQPQPETDEAAPQPDVMEMEPPSESSPTLKFFDPKNPNALKMTTAPKLEPLSGSILEEPSDTDQAESFRAITLFRDLTRPQILHVTGMMTPITLHDGEVLFRQGEASHRIYVITMGRLHVVIGETPVAELGPGQVAGEVALLDGETHSATLRAITRCRLLGLRREDLDDLIRAEPAFGAQLFQNLARTLAERLRATTALLERPPEE